MENEVRRTNKKTVITNETKERKTYKNPMEGNDPKKTTAYNSDNTTGRNNSKDIGGRRETQKAPV